VNDADQSLEDRLAKCYADQIVLYDGALRLLNPPFRAPEPTVFEEDWAAQLQVALRKVDAIDSAMAADKRAWQNAQRSPGDALRSILETLKQRIQTLAELVDHRIAALKGKRAQLMPELDDFIRQRRMRDAYKLAAGR
jgi:hypothetical protein